MCCTSSYASLCRSCRLSASTSQQAYERDEQRRPDDGPNDREALAADVGREEFRQVKGASQPYSDNRPDKSKRDRDQAATVTVARDRSANRAADSRNQQQNQKRRESHRRISFSPLYENIGRSNDQKTLRLKSRGSAAFDWQVT